jgi:hypothetical protein
LRPEDAAHGFRQPGLGAVSRALAGVALLWVPVLALHLTPALFAVLITYVGAAALAALLRRWSALRRHADALGLAMFIALAGGAAVVAVESAAEAAARGGGHAARMQQMALASDQLRALLPGWLSPHLPVSLEAAREAQPRHGCANTPRRFGFGQGTRHAASAMRWPGA